MNCDWKMIVNNGFLLFIISTNWLSINEFLSILFDFQLERFRQRLFGFQSELEFQNVDSWKLFLLASMLSLGRTQFVEKVYKTIDKKSKPFPPYVFWRFTIHFQFLISQTWNNFSHWESGEFVDEPIANTLIMFIRLQAKKWAPENSRRIFVSLRNIPKNPSTIILISIEQCRASRFLLRNVKHCLDFFFWL